MTTADNRTRTHRRLEEELATLRDRRCELAAGLGERDFAGDRADGADALMRSDDLAWVDDRIAELTERMRTLGTPEPRDGFPTGTVVRVRFDDGSVETLRAVIIPEEVAESDGVTALTADSPLGRALAGHRPGDVVEYPTPGGPAMVELLAVTLPAD